jgi:hypothetical protein
MDIVELLPVLEAIDHQRDPADASRAFSQVSARRAGPKVELEGGGVVQDELDDAQELHQGQVHQIGRRQGSENIRKADFREGTQSWFEVPLHRGGGGGTKIRAGRALSEGLLDLVQRESVEGPAGT